MNKAISAALLVVGVILLIYGLNASDSTASHISNTFTGKPTDQSMWLIISGVAGIVLGGATLLFSRRDS